RPGFKYTFGNGPEAFAFVGSIDIPNVVNSPYTGVDPEPIVNLELAKNWRASQRVTYGANLGYRLRQPTATPVDAQMFPLDDQITFSMGRSAPLWSKTGWVAEAIFSLPVNKDPYEKMVHAASADFLLGIKHRVRANMNIDAGVTAEPFIESQSPHFRVFAGLVYYFKPKWFDGKSKPEKEEQVLPAETMDQELATLTDEGEVPGRSSKPIRLGGLKVSPEYVEVFEGSTVEFQVESYNEPITMELIRGKGIVYDTEFIYRAPLRAESARIRFTDAVGSTKIVRVIVKSIPKADETLRIKNLKFVFAKAELIEQSRKEIQRIVRALRNKKVKRIIVEGHTDNVGSNRYNLELSEKRARTVRGILMDELFLKGDQVIAIGFGEERPIATNKTDRGRQENRRVDLKVYYGR
ncbi:MAG: OmpA family protein, partial [Bdellovibrionales bacterium]|nr:OmpA family protein [Bdellovibrionales bacterium]